ncbi:SpoIIE family protein phosphatase [Streptomyces sp. NPDC087903]|uniref:SpoIIE family protein phosphatase n=1 Tax=Streptomyces sp. NPDC087903 TaxID=3365819 RepID=UPI0038289F8C
MVRSGEDPVPRERTVGTGPTRIRERFLQGDPVVSGVRASILGSWQRSRSLGLSPDASELPFREDLDPDSRLVRAAVPVLDRLRSKFFGSRMNVSVADVQGTVVLRCFGSASLARSLPEIQRVPGFVFSERFAGTNGIGLALAERQLIQVHGAEHFAQRSQESACRAIPVRDPLSGQVEGVLCFGYPRSAEDPALAAVITKAAQAIEDRLLEQRSSRERTLLQTYLNTGGGAAAPSGVVGVEELAQGLRARDQELLKETATELISLAQQAALDVSLSDGRRLTLLSRPVTSASGVEGIAIEVLLPHPAELSLPTVPVPSGEPRRHERGQADSPHAPAERLSVPVGSGSVLYTSGREGVGAVAPSGFAAGPPVPRPAAGGVPGRRRPVRTAGVDPDGARERDGARDPALGLVMVGEPEVGRYALAARRRLELLSEASERIGTTLDVTRTAQELAETAVPQLADFVTIDLPETVLRGDESADPRGELRRTVVHGIRDDCPFSPVGKRIDYRPTTPQSRCLADGRAVLEPDLTAAADWLAQDPEVGERLIGHVRSLIAVPLTARGVVLGVAGFYRSRDTAAFRDDDLTLAQELAGRAALSLDNARRYTRERATVLALQRSLLPHGLPEQDTVEVAHRYLPAESGVGGDWYDVIPLSGTRVGLFVGDVVGHGLHSAATMGRLRTAARSFAELDFPPEEVLTHLDNLVLRLDREEGREDLATDSVGIIGATCLYAIYDPATQQCAMARAGHPPPALVQPDGTVSFPDLPAGPPLGLGGFPFETAELHIPEHSRLVLYTDGLIEDRHYDIDVALDRLRTVLARCDGTPEETCQAVLDIVAPAHPCDDIAVLVVRTHALDPGRIATWDLPSDPAVVSEVRAAATRQLAEWGLEETAFAAELLLSELVTNAIRHGAGPIRVRLLHERALICEVSDSSNTAPHLRRAAANDEGGRGLFLVAQLSQAWGTRYTTEGKVIWAECALDAP